MRRQDLKDFGLRRQTEVSSFENKLALVSSCEQDFEPKVSEYLILLRFMTLQFSFTFVVRQKGCC
jgi:hypothetical protein